MIEYDQSFASGLFKVMESKVYWPTDKPEFCFLSEGYLSNATCQYAYFQITENRYKSEPVNLQVGSNPITVRKPAMSKKGKK
jgi:hypothetical protein